jgi:hypothetical protein
MFEASFNTVEKALIGAFGVRPRDVGAFRGRLIAAQKAGLLGPKNQPGKGRALTYTPDLFHRMILTCELTELGIAPSVILELVARLWDRKLRSIFKLAETAAMQPPGDHDVVLYIGGVALMTGSWSSKLPGVNRCSLKELPAQVADWMKMREDDPAPANLPPRVILTNLSHRLRCFHAALAQPSGKEAAQRR